MGRPTKVVAAYNRSTEIWTRTEYDDVLRRVITRSDLEVKGDGKKVAIRHFDELGRVRLARAIEDIASEDPTNEEDGIKVQTRYKYDDGANPASSNGVYSLSSNPYRATKSSLANNEETMGWTVSYAPKDGKYSTSESFSGASLPAPFGSNSASTGIVRTDIDANRTLVTDQAGKQRISKTNALGHLTDVWENKASDTDTVAVSFPNKSSVTHGYKTSYSYDTLNNLTTVNQGQQTRTFTYSSLSRLKSANNPESGTISYVYDVGGNLTSKTDARSITTTYVYDNINRVTTRSYSDGITPTVNYTYDNKTNAIGQLTKVTNGTSSTEYTKFDRVGRVEESEQRTPTGTETLTTTTPRISKYTYNLSGGLIEQTYPSGRVVKNVIDKDRQLAVVQSKKNANAGFHNYANSFTYNATGAVESMQLGNGKWESTTFNSRLQPTQIALGTTQNETDKLKRDYTYGTTTNNGNVQSQTITVPDTNAATGFTAIQTYDYDELNRLKSAEEKIASVTSSKQTYTFDRYGNRRFDEANTDTLQGGCATAVCNPTIDPATNKLVGYTFDNAGNTKVDANGQTFTYDAENKQILVKDSQQNKVGEYFYDGDGKRVKKIAGSEETIFVYNASGQLVAEYSTLISQTPKVSYLTSDHLGSPRITTDADGDVYTRRDFMPFGEEIDSGHTLQRTATLNYATDEIKQKFTSYERDNETELDFAQARMYSSKHGRFTTTDPIIMKDDRMIDPQRINLYAYVRNNPLLYVDESGEDLSVSGNTTDAVLTLQQILGTDDAAKRITYDSEKGLTVDLKGIDLTKNEGASLLNDLVTSDNNYQFHIGDTVETANGTIVVGDIQNLSNNAERSAKPPVGVDGMVAIDPERENMISVVKGVDLKKPPSWTNAFHELAESYEKVDNGKKYVGDEGAHNTAMNREATLRNQRPTLKNHVFGGGVKLGEKPNTSISGDKLNKHRTQVQKKNG